MTYVCSSEFGNFVITPIYSYTWFMKNQTIMEKVWEVMTLVVTENDSGFPEQLNQKR
jgi:hypothetical protein